MSQTTVIRGGTVVDGTGAPGLRADVAMSDGHITEVGRNLKGDVTVEADGCAVAPGFIDIHTHYDAQVFWDPALTPSCFHGVTTVVAGNCGFSIAPVKPADRAPRCRPPRCPHGSRSSRSSRTSSTCCLTVASFGSRAPTAAKLRSPSPACATFRRLTSSRKGE